MCICVCTGVEPVGAFPVGSTGLMDCYNPDREYNTTLPEFVVQDKDNPFYSSQKNKTKKTTTRQQKTN